MSLKVNDAASLLNVSTRTILTWIHRRGLPASRVRDDYRISRMDLMEWATENGIPLPPDLLGAPDARKRPPTLEEALRAGGLHHDVGGEQRDQVLGNVVELLDLPEEVDREFLLSILLAREDLGTTAIGNGIAIPHARNPILMGPASPMVTLCILRHPVDFQALDGQPVDILFTIISPTVQIHLHLLSRLAYVLHNQTFRELLRTAPALPAVLAAVAAIEAEIPTMVHKDD